MSGRLQQIVYRSEARGDGDSLLTLSSILAESSRNNARDGLTGALAAHGGCYLQVLEGPAHALDSLMRRLDGDPRHKGVEVIDRSPIDSRSFADWAMASARITPSLARSLDTLMAEPDASGVQIARLLKSTLDNPA